MFETVNTDLFLDSASDPEHQTAEVEYTTWEVEHTIWEVEDTIWEVSGNYSSKYAVTVSA